MFVHYFSKSLQVKAKRTSQLLHYNNQWWKVTKLIDSSTVFVQFGGRFLSEVNIVLFTPTTFIRQL